jgi:hypothetical protein
VTLDLSDAEMPEHLAGFALRIEAETPAYYVVACEDRYFALARQLGPPDIGAELLGEEDLPPLVLMGASLDEVREKVQVHQVAQELQRAAEAGEQYPVPHLVESHRGFNLVRLHDQVYGLRQSLGPIDVAPGREGSSVHFGTEDAVVGKSLDEVKARIDAVEAELVIRDLTKQVQALTRVDEQT